ncbi:lanthionine synthetase LanC family protein [Micromonospora sp. NPDC004551]|uniref:lanthionine synthetase LanC family protein n=1 Tax=Micromonospora sp. NPDC004551 TaxID=3154284 RepID=UPI0033A6CA8B
MTVDVVQRAFGWIESVAVPADGGLAWLEAGERFDDLYAGTAGILLGCAEAGAAGLLSTSDGPVEATTGGAATASGSALDRVAAGARDRLVHLARHEPDAATMPDDGLFGGWAGVAVALRAWAAVSADRVALDAAAVVTARIAERLLRRPVDPARYSDVISGDAGILLALLDACDDGADGVVVQAAHLLADGLVGLAEDRPDGLHWRMLAGHERLMPGFSHGTAGVAYALAAAGNTLHRDDLLDTAVRAADGLLALGSHPDGWALPLLIPPRPDRPPVNFGWCHGPTGTVRLFTLLDTVDPQPRWRQAVDACLGALRDSRIPQRLYPGYWDNLARCCGTAGVGQLLLDRFRATADPALLTWANVLAADVLARTVPTSTGVTWSNTEHTRTPPDLPPEPGFMQGTAGIVGWLARLAAPATPPVLPWL